MLHTSITALLPSRPLSSLSLVAANMTDYWRIETADLEGEIANTEVKIDAVVSDRGEEDDRPRLFKAAVGRIADLLELGDLGSDAVPVETLREALLPHIEGYIALVRKVAAGPTCRLPLSPPLHTLLRSSLLRREAQLLCALDSYKDNREVQIVDDLCSSSGLLASVYASKMVKELIAPFWYACLAGTRGFMWHVNGDSLALCGLVGLCRVVLREAQTRPSAPDEVKQSAQEAASCVTSALIEACVRVFRAVAEESSPKSEHALNALKTTITLAVFVRRAVPVLITEQSYEQTLKPKLESLAVKLCSSFAVADHLAEQATFADSLVRGVSPLTEDQLLDSSLRDSSFLEE